LCQGAYSAIDRSEYFSSSFERSLEVLCIGQVGHTFDRRVSHSGSDPFTLQYVPVHHDAGSPINLLTDQVKTKSTSSAHFHGSGGKFSRSGSRRRWKAATRKQLRTKTPVTSLGFRKRFRGGASMIQILGALCEDRLGHWSMHFM
jgi:hypothetical protein